MLGKRETGRHCLKQDTLTSKYYKHFKIAGSQDEEHAAIFNLEFSPSGKMLVAACEASAILLYDPIHRKCLHRLTNAHDNSVNCIRFCDERIFASGSDDCSIALWDTRMLDEPIMKLLGHTNWVKSLVYDKNTGFLLSSAFDGTVRGWEINRSLSSREDLNGTVFVRRDSVSRIELTAEGDKLILSCSAGEPGFDTTLIFHNLDLHNFEDDITNKCSDQTRTEFRNGDNRNIPERLNRDLEYPKSPVCISSFRVHPNGWCLASRYFTMNNFQFTTVHDIRTSSYGKVLKALN